MARKQRSHRNTRKGGNALWIQQAIKRPDTLHKSLHIPTNKDIPLSKLRKAAHSKNTLLRRRAILAETLRKFHKK